MKLLPLGALMVVVALAASACGANTVHEDVSTPHGANMPAAAAPVYEGRGRPPEAYIEFGAPGRWMEQGSSCWSNQTGPGSAVTGCMDTIGPGEMHLPTLHLAAGTVGHIHVGFVPTKAQLRVGAKSVPVTPGRDISFTANRSGIVELFLKHPDGDAVYYSRVIVGHA